MEANSDSVGIDVVLPEEGRTAPCCPHGPTLLFEKVGKGGNNGRRFYACSACRDRKDCSFFQWEDEKVSEARMLAREAEMQSKMPGLTRQDYCNRFLKYASLPLHEKRFCEDCQILLLPAEHGAHSAHRTAPVTAAQLRRPSVLLRPLYNKKSNAQYLFTDRSAHFLLDTLAGLGYRKVLCVGTPRLQELIKLRNLEQKQEPMQSLLLDIDFRYAQFYSQDEFCHYNMFNHHFFGGEASSAVLDAFLRELDGKKVIMVADPPFGGLVKPLANSFSLISQTWRKQQNPGDSNVDMPIIWIFPYFFEPRILECLPSLTMLDYQPGDTACPATAAPCRTTPAAAPTQRTAASAAAAWSTNAKPALSETLAGGTVTDPKPRDGAGKLPSSHQSLKPRRSLEQHAEQRKELHLCDFMLVLATSQFVDIKCTLFYLWAFIDQNIM
uniref:rRNA N(6)-adenosine-methyltransferase ZCCHC4 n=1 Tax=Fundulus heteroclitus TaxID=8078 RepID=A0A3Q2NY18_FUNHE